MHGWLPGQYEYLLTLKHLTKEEALAELNRKYPERQKSNGACRKKLEGEGEPYWGNFTVEPSKPVAIAEQVSTEREIMRHQAEVSILKKKYNSLLKEKAFEDRIIGDLHDNLLRIGRTKPPKYVKPKSTQSEEVLGIVISDSHIGEVVSAEETFGLEQYDFDIFRLRLQHYLDSIINIMTNKLKGYVFNKINVFMLGDMVSGMIHSELIEAADRPVTEQVLNGAEVFSLFFSELAQMGHKIEVDCVYGNHGGIRYWGKKQFKKRYVNWDFMFYKYLEQRLAEQDNIKFNIYKSFFVTREIAGHNFLLLHGDDIRAWMGIPYYGIERKVKDFQELLASRGEIIDYVLLAHFHRAATLDKVHGEKIMNGSFMKGNEFVLGACATMSQPKQWIFGIHPKKGITFRFPIVLDQTEGEVRYLLEDENSI